MEAVTAANAPYEVMGATLLSQQPATLPDKLPKEEEGWDTIFSHLEARLGMMRSWRFSWWAFWAVLARFFIPRRYHWLVVANKMDRGQYLNNSIVDSTGLQAVRTCKSGMWTGLTSPSRPWFKLGKALPWVTLDADGQSWLEDTEQRIYTVFAQSNFYSTMSQGFEDEVVFGSAPIIVYEDQEDVVRFYLPCCGEYYLDLGGRLEVDTLYREFTLNVIQLVDMFKIKNCPDPVRKAWAQGGASLQLEFVVAHAIEPNFPISKRGTLNEQIRVVPGGFAYREVYWLKGIKSQKPLSKKGFHSKPFFVLKWSTVSNDPYGRSPCMDAIGDNKQVQLESQRKAEYLDKGVRPPMGADQELKNEPASIIPAQITYMNTAGGKKGFWPLFEVNPAWLGAITADIGQVNQRLEKCLYVDVFMAISKMEGVQPRNELELTKRDLERLQELGPVIDLAENALSTCIERVMDILERRRMLKPKPASLNNVPLKINYVSIMRLAQRSAESVAMKDTFQTAGQLSSGAKAAGVPDPLRVINLDKAMRHYADLNNFPADCLFTDDEVKAHDQIRDQEMKKAKAEAQVPGAAMAGVKAAQTLSQTELPGGNSALGALMGQG